MSPIVPSRVLSSSALFAADATVSLLKVSQDLDRDGAMNRDIVQADFAVGSFM